MVRKKKKIKKLTIISLSALALLSIALILLFHTFRLKNEPFYLEDKYYGAANLTHLDKDRLQQLEASKESFATLIHTPGNCSAPIPFEPLVKKFTKQNNLTLYEVNFRDIKGTKARECAKFSPSVVIYKEGNVITCLDAVNDEHLPYYMSVDGFSTWFTKYVKLKE